MLNSAMYHIVRLPERAARARALADDALRQAPELGDTHLALALCYYRIDRHYEAALKELALAGTTLPNNSEVLDFSGYILSKARSLAASAGRVRARQGA